ncbi:complement C1q subcomponent subunit C-like isoform X2 [Argopecten irradians]|uniref:complement C1q subcomponent subunit C-like isoform X2 n=1 Tax=Argopecten irradians TaxID=31199 RepID=UPI00371C49CC
MARCFVFTVCVLILDVSFGLASPSMVGDGSTDPVLLQVQRLLLKHEAQIEALQKENIRLAEKSLTLEGEVKFLREKTVSLEEKIVTLEDKITSLEQDQPSADETEITTPCPEESNGIDGSRITRQPKDGVKKISKRVDSTTDSIIAFHAILTHTITDPGTDHIVQFDKMVTDIGSHYNSQTGEFICREVGVYKFSWMIFMTGNPYIYTDLVRNGKVIGSSISGDTVWDTTGLALAITMLVPGDLVWERVSTHNSGADIHPTHTMFNGFRLH